MKKLSIAIISGTLSITACADGTDNKAEDSNLTGKRFFDSAATKLMAGAPELNRVTANCVVKAMTADGKIGLGEINTSTLNEKGVPERGSLQKAYLAALKDCG